MASEMVRSSTYIQLLDLIGEWLIRSLTVIKNRMGSSLVPCGNPAVTAVQLEVEWQTLTNCVRPERKLQIQGIRDLRTTRLMSFVMTML